MDHKFSKPDTDSFVDDRMARLDPSPDWQPDAGRALKKLTQRKPSSSPQWMRLGMTATILAATVFVLALLPWQRLWTPKPVAMVAAQTQTAPAEKPAEKGQETPAPKRAAETAPLLPAAQAPATPTPPQGDVLRNLPAAEAELAGYLEQLAQQRGVASEASQANVSEPKVLTRVLPEYSDQAREAKIQGTVEMLVTIKIDGTVKFESFRKTLGYGLDEKAREAIEQWTFTPGTKDGVPVATLVTLSMNFSLR